MNNSSINQSYQEISVYHQHHISPLMIICMHQCNALMQCMYHPHERAVVNVGPIFVGSLLPLSHLSDWPSFMPSDFLFISQIDFLYFCQSSVQWIAYNMYLLPHPTSLHVHNVYEQHISIHRISQISPYIHFYMIMIIIYYIVPPVVVGQITL